MQVKKFEAPTIQEALENVKRELGPEAIILQTKRNRRGFGLLSKASIEVTAAVSERSLEKKQKVESNLTEASRVVVKNLPAERQADIIEKYTDRNLAKASQTREQVEVSKKAKRITATRYIDIEDSPQIQTADGARSTPNASAPPAYTSMGKAATLASAGVDKAIQSAPATFKPMDIRAEKVPPELQFGSGERLEEEVKNLKKVIEQLQSPSYSEQNFRGTQAPLLQDAFDQLVMHGVDRRHAYSLLKKVAFELGENGIKHCTSEQILDCLAGEVMQSIEVQSIFPNPSEFSAQSGAPIVIVLVGPTGVGKTTTVAKLASEARLKRNLKIGLVNLDNQKLGSFDQLATYAQILNAPFRSAFSVDDFRAALQDFRNSDVVLVDTGGFSKKNEEALKKTTEILKVVPDARVYVVLSASTREVELYDAVNRFSITRPRGMILSKLDEASVFGSIYNVSQKVKLPLAYFTTGQRIPEDIEQATPERVVSLIMDL